MELAEAVKANLLKRVDQANLTIDNPMVEQTFSTVAADLKKKPKRPKLELKPIVDTEVWGTTRSPS